MSSAAMSSRENLPPGIWKIVAVTVCGTLLAQMDATVVNVSLSQLAADLHASLQWIQWVTSGYLLALALTLPLNGWLVERLGAKRVYLLCFTGFTLSSALCAMSWSANSLIGFRILQGMSGGLMAPMAQLMIARAAGKQMAQVAGYAVVPVLLGPIAGPVLAGAILQYATWHWLFLINVPIGILGIVLAILFLPRDGHEERSSRKLDIGGLLLLSPALVLLLYGMEHLNGRVGLAAFGLSLTLLAAFFYKARQDGEHALLDLKLLRRRVFATAAMTQFTGNGLLFAAQMLVPVYLMRGAGESPSMTGWLMAPIGLGMMITSPFVGRLTQRYGIRGTSSRGAMLALVSTLLLIFMSMEKLNPWLLGAVLFLRGMGTSAIGIPSMSAAYASVPKAELPMATTSLNIVQRLGGPTLTTLCAGFLGWRLGGAHIGAGRPEAFPESFTLLCGLQLLLWLATLRLPRGMEEAEKAQKTAAAA
uniref:DHA2 family efflux MFS transporter permease subunit n=1 Tax=Acidobacterium capsulatum TaxID=33075 RepID=A0A7V4XUD4_9BACT